MATQETYETNILDQEAVDWRRIVYPVVGVIAAVVIGFTIYYYQLSQQDAREQQARQAIINAKTPADLAKVADDFPHTSQAVLALISAADLAVTKRDFTEATKDYQRVIGMELADAVLKDSARVGLASVYESTNQPQLAIDTYLQVGRRGKESPYAPYAYFAAARMDDQKHDRTAERQTLIAAAGLGVDSPFVKQAALKLKQLNATELTPAAKPVPLPANVPH
jgi:predicted DNA binding CopG/RHH family protein